MGKCKRKCLMNQTSFIPMCSECSLDLHALTHPRSPSKKVMKAVRKMVMGAVLKETGKNFKSGKRN
jgi:hypothetical protein